MKEQETWFWWILKTKSARAPGHGRGKAPWLGLHVPVVGVLFRNCTLNYVHSSILRLWTLWSHAYPTATKGKGFVVCQFDFLCICRARKVLPGWNMCFQELWVKNCVFCKFSSSSKNWQKKTSAR